MALKQCPRNSSTVLSLLDHIEIPVSLRIDHPSSKDEFLTPPADIHGKSGIGEVAIPDANKEPETTSAVEFHH